MVIGVSLTSIEIPNLGCCDEGKFIQCKHLNRDTAWL